MANVHSNLAIPEIPPFNPHSKKRKQEQAHGEPANEQQRPQSAYASSDAQPRPSTSTAASSKAAYRASVHVPGLSASAAPSTHAAAAAGIGIYPAASTSHGPSNAPSKPKVYFGPYQLLQTLGEGEFGKVKLGVRGDARWGEEVAIKLIKRGSVQDSQQRMTKVMREIEVLRVVKHPNIVRLQDVIDTEKYIGIVLEYASGGELFDHILAHRYLKDKDAAKLFAQLISGVHYLHSKKIVHRDLKLENLLLDRNRNIIITDFGFANRFENKGDDLMATSCGSPCYAAPELVVQDGKYVGRAVDVWSCGVILYAMLAGYLPFDDDPANPDSENINLLYKYIISTPLSFPDWIPAEPRVLLLRMLVPDPLKRCTLQDVMDHPWLSKNAQIFELTVDELEAQVAAADAAKQRHIERVKESILHPEFEQQMTRSQSTQVSRHQSAVVTSSTIHQAYQPNARAAPMPYMAPSTQEKRRAHAQSAIVVPSASTTQVSTSADVAIADPFSYTDAHVSPLESVPMAASHSAPGRSVEARSSPLTSHLELEDRAALEEAARKKRAQAHRYTVQVEYDAPASTPNFVETRPSTRASKRSREPEVKEEIEALKVDVASLQPPSKSSLKESPTESVASSAVPDHGHSTPRASRHSILIPTDPLPPAASGEVTPTVASVQQQAQQPRVPFPSPEREKRGESVVRKASDLPPSPKKSSTPSLETRPPKVSSIDRFSISRLLGASTNSNDRLTKGSDSSSTNPESPALDELTNKRKGARRKALSMVVEPFKQSTGSKSKRQSVKTLPATPDEKPRTRSTTLAASATRTPASSASPQRPARGKDASVASSTTLNDPAWVANGPPQGKAKRVMDWFRWRSMPKDSSLSDIAGQNSNVAAAAADLEPKTRQQHRNSVIIQNKLQESQNAAPQVVVSPIPDGRSTVDIESQPSSRSASGSASLEAAVTPAQFKRHSMAASFLQREPSVASTRTASGHSKQVDLSYYEARLRFHSGAVDQNALTNRKPIIVLADLRKVLKNMGVEVREETTPFRLKCIRQSSKKVAALYGLPIASVHVADRETLSTSQSRPDSRAGLPMSPSLSTGMPTSTSFRNFFGRRGSSTSAHMPAGPGMPSPALSLTSSEAPDLLLSPLNRSTSSVSNNNAPLPFYGDNEPGAEVRFTVEISRLKNLPDLFAIDIRRLKGNLWSYRAIYCEIINSLPKEGTTV